MKNMQEKCEEFAKEHMTGEYAAYDLLRFIEDVYRDEELSLTKQISELECSNTLLEASLNDAERKLYEIRVIAH